MDQGKLAVLVTFGLAAAGVLYFASQASGDAIPVPEAQTELQVMGMGIKAGLNLGAGTPLDSRVEVHFWDPVTNPRDKNHPGPVITCRHRYPAIPGGNISTVMHKGWSQFSQLAPAGNDWFLNPPSVAVL